eukprot:185117-Prymnesium_polylepis.1
MRHTRAFFIIENGSGPAGAWSSAAEARALIGDFEQLVQPSKLGKRLSLMFSKTYRVFTDLRCILHTEMPLDLMALRRVDPAPEGEIRIIVVDDIFARDSSGAQVLDSKGKPCVMTDGAGLISLNLAEMIPPIASGEKQSEAE